VGEDGRACYGGIFFAGGVRTVWGVFDCAFLGDSGHAERSYRAYGESGFGGAVGMWRGLIFWVSDFGEVMELLRFLMMFQWG